MPNMSRRREARKQQAAEMHEARQTRTPKQQLALLDSRLGKGKGATKERARLLEQINEHAPTKSKKEPKTRSDRRKAKAARNAAKRES